MRSPALAETRSRAQLVPLTPFSYRMPTSMRRAGTSLVCAIVIGLLPSLATAQDHVTARADFLFYGDNTEFTNPFRAGDTTFGVAGSAALTFDVGEYVRLYTGIFGNGRFGSPAGVEQWRPVIAFEMRRGGSRLTFGSFEAPRRPEGPGPDRIAPHGMLPPMESEILAFRRPWEAGIEWQHAGARLKHDIWINWQRLNTPSRREVFDTGAKVEVPFNAVVSAVGLAHVLHHGGQQFNGGAVSDSSMYGGGVVLRPPAPVSGPLSIELYGLGSEHVPDRAHHERTTTGKAFFGRLAYERDGWRGHLIAWRGDTVLKEGGDPNYLSRRRDGTLYLQTRDYSEAGVTRLFRPAPGAEFEVSARFHHIEGHFEYSYRVLARVGLQFSIR